MHHLHTSIVRNKLLFYRPGISRCTATDLNIGNNRLKQLPEALGLMHQIVKFACPQNRITYLRNHLLSTNLTQPSIRERAVNASNALGTCINFGS